jgi:hypothetical protein
LRTRTGGREGPRRARSKELGRQEEEEEEEEGEEEEEEEEEGEGGPWQRRPPWLLNWLASTCR